jgi:hypothetical protein
MSALQLLQRNVHEEITILNSRRINTQRLEYIVTSPPKEAFSYRAQYSTQFHMPMDHA